jgi:hypothetical protein
MQQQRGVTMLDLRGRGVPDVFEASCAWGANCGPTAIAAALGLTMAEVRPAVCSTGEFKGHMGVRDFTSAIPRAGGRIVRTWHRPDKRELRRTDGSPIVVLIRFGGPWDLIPDESVRARVGARYRHAFCYRHGYVEPVDSDGQTEHGPGWVCDANNLVRAGFGIVATWLPLHLWRSEVLPGLVPERGTGETVIDWMAQVIRAHE